MKILLSLLFLFASMVCVYGQSVNGKVVDSNQHPVEFANIVLLSLPDSAFVQGAVSGTDGSFKMPVTVEKGVLKVSCIGYVTFYKAYDGGKDVGMLPLEPDALVLGEVVVKGDLPQTRLKNGARLTAVAGSVLEKAGTAENLLNRIPGVSAAGGKVNVFGRGTAEVYINGRKVRDGAELDRLSSENIKSVEVVNNPGARYAASVKSVVRITTKRMQGEGFGFDNRVEVQHRHDWTTLEQFNFNYRKNGFDLTGTLFGSDARNEYYKSLEQTTYLDKTWKQNSVLVNTSHRQNLSGTLAMNYQFNTKHSLGVRYNYKRLPKEATGLDMNTDVLLDGQLYEQAYNTNPGHTRTTGHYLNAYYHGTVGGWELDFNADALWNEYKEKNFGLEKNSLVEGDVEERTITTASSNDNTLYAAKLTASHTLAGGELLFGSEYSYNRRGNMYANTEGILKGDDSEIKEDIWALFGEYNHALGKGGMQLGVRYEHMISDYFEKGVYMEEQSRKYDNVFPTASLFYPLGKVQLQLGYAADITRPNYSQLCGGVTYVNRYTYESGNPFLKPTLAHNLTLDVSYRQWYVSVGYQYIKDGMSSLCDSYSDDNPAVSLIWIKNIADYNKMSGMLVYNPRIGKWNPQWVAAAERQWYKADTPSGKVCFNHPLGSFLWKNSVELPYGIFLSADAALVTCGDSENVRMEKVQWGMDFGLYKEFAKKRLSCRLQVKDAFNTMDENVKAYSGIRVLQMKTEAHRRITLTLRYKLNTAKNKYKGTGAGASQKSRM